MKRRIFCTALLAIFMVNAVAPLIPAQDGTLKDRLKRMRNTSPTARVDTNTNNPSLTSPGNGQRGQNTPQGQSHPQGFSLSDIVDAVEDLASDAANLVKKAEDGILQVGKDIVQAGASVFDGPGAIVGVFVGGGIFFLGNPNLPKGIVPAVIVGAGAATVTNALIKHRHMTAEERAFAERVFHNSLPPNDKIWLTNLEGLNHREFTIPNVNGEILVNLGAGYSNPTSYMRSRYPVPGQVFIHELTHAWQIYHRDRLGVTWEAISEQVRKEFGDNVYAYNCDGRPWRNYLLEQQAELIDDWFAGGMNIDDECRYDRVVTDLRGEALDLPVGRLFRAVNDYATKHGYVSAIPTFFQADYGHGQVLGAVLIKAGLADWRDIPASELGNPRTPEEKLRAVAKYATAHGYKAAFPNFNEANYGSGTVYGTILLKPEAADWQDIPAAQLGNPRTAQERIRAAGQYATAHGYVGALPNFYEANYGSGTVYGTVLIKRAAADWKDLSAAELSLAPSAPAHQGTSPRILGRVRNPGTAGQVTSDQRNPGDVVRQPVGSANPQGGVSAQDRVRKNGSSRELNPQPLPPCERCPASPVKKPIIGTVRHLPQK